MPPDAYTYGPLLEACRKAGHRQRARGYGRQMLKSYPKLPLSPFCLASLRKTMGATQLQALCEECDVPWGEVEGALAKAAESAEERRLSRGGGGANASPARKGSK